MDITNIVKQYYKSVDSAEYLGNDTLSIITNGNRVFYKIIDGKLFLYRPEERS